MVDVLISGHMLTALGHALVHSLWQFTLLAFLGASVKRFGVGLSKSSKYWVSFILLLVCGLSFGVTFDHYYSMAPHMGAIVDIPVEATLQPLPESGALSEAPTALEGLFDQWSGYLPFMVKLWILGVLLLSLKQIAEYIFLRHLRHYGVQAPSKDWIVRFEALQQKMGVSGAVTFLESTLLKGIGTFGYLKPMILIPAGMLSQLTEAQVEALILHELAHIKRNDYLHNLIVRLFETLFFSHPGIWWLSRQVKELREESCDEMVCRTGTDPLLYAEALIQSARFSSSSKVTLVMNANAHLANRIQQLLQLPTSSSGTQAAMPLGLSGMLLILALSTIGFVPALQSQPVVSIDQGVSKTLYLNTDNPLTIAISGVADKDVVVTAPDHLNLKKDGAGLYVAHPVQPGGATLEIEAPGLGQVSVDFSVERYPDPTANLAGLKGGKMEVEVYKRLERVRLSASTTFNQPCEVSGFSMVQIIPKQDPVEVIVKGAAFSEPAKRLMSKAIPGTMTYFDEVRCLCPGDEEPRQINSMVFKLEE
jgi:beta-lactamase regulating signal transducer with metallopeptidase domain